MNLRRLILLALSVATAGLAASPAFSQVSVYADLGVSEFTNPSVTNILVGPTIGVTGQFGQKGRLALGADIRASFIGGTNRLDQASVGPKVTIPFRGNQAYGEFLVGFGRYNDGLGTSGSASTDAEIQFVMGLDHRVSNRISWRVFEYAYEQYYGVNGEYNPKTFSTGIVFHFSPLLAPSARQRKH